ncbi:MAG: hypothetical protein HZA93_18960 [Verrucomicrobia bacterium]|nr:hypothetical protein [Verrucomicrobiota bacterium]
MRSRVVFAIAAAILLGLAAWFFLKEGPAVPGRPGLPLPSAATPTTSTARPIENQKSKTEDSPSLSGYSDLAAELNAPAGTIRRDLEILHEIFATFQTNFPRTGNPVGENAEITAALLGANAHRFAFIRPGHRALNARGELVDRWGTPFRFHQLSGTQMEIRSAGPDGKFGTSDDAEFSPGGSAPAPR